ncbi:MAG: hypothetical protein FJY80_01220 [Candidatus Aminicenantes bacterium]|nr:hypothetical protein [Candidatus Aminicenantes bacterium]
MYKIQKRGKTYHLLVNGRVLRTPGGAIISSSKRALFLRIIADFDGQPSIEESNGIILSPRVHSAYLLASTQIDFVDKGDHPFRSIRPHIINDPIFNTAGHPHIYMFQVATYQKALEFLRKAGIEVRALHPLDRVHQEGLELVISTLVNGLTNPEMSVLINLHTIHGGHFIYPLLLMKKECTSKEYARAVFAGSPDVVRITGQRPIGAFLSVPAEEDEKEEKNEIDKIVRSYQEDAQIALRYINLMANEVT